MTDATRREPFTKGDEFLQYRIHSLLGRGGHAFVYSGQHLYMERPVAIKVIPAPAEINGEIYKRAQLEAKVLSQLEHPNVVKVYDAGVTDTGVIYIVMEMLEGWTLRAALKSVGMFTVPETLHIGVQVASAVELAHAQKAIHRDLKPENVFVLPGNVIKVLDFGITKLLGTNTTLTQPQVIRGTPQYMSPEHMEGRAVTARSDIYALGSVLYELLAGIAPTLVGLQDASSYAIGYSQIHRMPPRLDEVSPEIPRYVARLIQRMLAKDPVERPASMQQVADELRGLQTRFAADCPTMAGVLRELWREQLLEPQSSAPLPSSPSAADGVFVLTKPKSSSPAPSSPSSPLLQTRAIDHGAPTPTALVVPGNANAGAEAFPVPRRTQQKSAETPSQSPLIAARRAPDAMALRLADRRSSSSAPVTLQRSGSSRTLTPSHTTSLVLVAVVLGGVIGYGALMSLRRVSDRSSNASRAPATVELAASIAPIAPSSVSSPRTPIAQSTTANPLIAQPSSTIGAALANTDSVPVQPMTSSKTAATSSVPGSHAIDAAETDSSTARLSKDASQERALRPTGSSTARSGKTPAAKERLLFGAEDLSW